MAFILWTFAVWLTRVLPRSARRLAGHQRPGQDQGDALPGADPPGGLHQRPAVRLARPLRGDPARPAQPAEHHVADDRAHPVREGVRRREDRQPAAGDAARR